MPEEAVPPTSTIRLQTDNGTLSFDSAGQVQGRLEINVEGDWATVLGGGGYPHAITEAEASVACRQLGNELGYELSSSSKIDRANTDDGSGKAYLIACAGTEASLDSCASFEYVTWASSNHM